MLESFLNYKNERLFKNLGGITLK